MTADTDTPRLRFFHAPNTRSSGVLALLEELGAVAGREGAIRARHHHQILQRRRAGVRLHRVSRLAERVQPNRNPPRVSLEHAVVDVASEAPDEAAAVAVLADACQSRRTTPARLAGALRERRRTPRRGFLLDLLLAARSDSRSRRLALAERTS